MIERVWLFMVRAPSASSLEDKIATIHHLRVTDVAVYVNGNKTCDFALDEERAEDTKAFAARLRDIDVDTNIVSWIRPDGTYIRDCANALRPLCVATRARSLLLNAEEAWLQNAKFKRVAGRSKPKPVRCARGRVTLEKVKAATNRVAWKPFAEWPCMLGVTDVTSIEERSRLLEPLIRRCFYVLPQAYNRTIPRINRQRWAHRLWREYFNSVMLPAFSPTAPTVIRKPMIMGLSGMKGTTKKAMRAAVDTVEALQDPVVKEIAYWSAGPIFATKWKREFVRNTSVKARARLPQSHPDDIVDFVDQLLPS